MDIRFFIVGTPLVLAFFYTLFWLRKWDAFNSPNDNLQKKMTLENEFIKQKYILEKIFLTKN